MPSGRFVTNDSVCLSHSSPKHVTSEHTLNRVDAQFLIELELNRIGMPCYPQFQFSI
jgi:hypothetical protein